MVNLTLPVSREISELLKNIRHGTTSGDYEDRQLEQAAEAEVSKENESESAFMTMLDYLGRPQAAVAGTIKDMIDGGSFNPLDRVGQALMGEERYRIKDVIDVIAPGDWSNMKLPDWMGGKDIDIFKESVGFVGDVLTDPLNQLRIGSLLGKFKKADIGLAATMFRWTSKFKSAKKLEAAATFGARQKKVFGSNAKTVQAFQRNMLHQQTEANYLDNLVKEYSENQQKFLDEYIPEGMQKEFTENIDDIAPYLNTGEYAVGGLGEQFREGQRRLLGWKIPFVQKQLGISDLANVGPMKDRLNKVMGDSVDLMFEGMVKNKQTARMVKWFKDSFSHSSGYSSLDYSETLWRAREGVTQKTADAMAESTKKVFAPYSREEAKKIIDLAERPAEDWGRVAREIDPKLAPGVHHMRRINNELNRLEKAAGIQYKEIGWKPLNDKDAYEKMRATLRKENPEKYERMPTYKQIRSRAKIETEKLGVGDIDSNTKMWLDGGMRQATDWLGHSIPLGYQGYFPRHLTEEAKGMLDNLFSSTRVSYRDKDAYSFFLSNSQNRTFRDMTVNEINETLMSQDMYGWWDEVIGQIPNNLKTRKQKHWWNQIIKEVEPGATGLFIDDPIQAITARIGNSTKAITKKQRIQQAVMMTGRELGEGEIPRVGEIGQILSPAGMEAVYGPDWKKVLGKDAYSSYEGLVGVSSLNNPSSLSDYFLPIRDRGDLANVKRMGIPSYAMPATVFDEVGKWSKLMNSPDEWSGLMDKFNYITNWWKGITLAPFPGYHLRNLLGSVTFLHLGDALDRNIVKNLGDTKNFMIASGQWKEGAPGFAKWASQKARGTKDTFIAGPTPSLESLKIKAQVPDGVTYTGNDLLRFEQKYKFLGGYYGAEAKAIAKGQGLGEGGTLKKVFKELTHEGQGVKSLFYAGNVMENQMRMTHFIARLRKGDSPYEAAMSVKKYHGSFDELTRLEKKVATALPFYRWMRHNIPLQLQGMATKPAKYNRLGQLARMLQSEEGQKFDKSKLPRWVNENMGIPTKFDKKTGEIHVKILKSWLPAADLMPIVSTDPVGGAGKLFKDYLHPIPKTMAELSLNKSFFTDQPIKETGVSSGEFLGMAMDRKVIHVLKNIRAANELDKFFKGKTTSGTYTMGDRLWNLAGVVPKTKKFDVEQLEKRKKFDVAIKKAQYRKALRTAERFGHNKAAEYMQGLIEDLGND